MPGQVGSFWYAFFRLILWWLQTSQKKKKSLPQKANNTKIQNKLNKFWKKKIDIGQGEGKNRQVTYPAPLYNMHELELRKLYQTREQLH